MEVVASDETPSEMVAVFLQDAHGRVDLAPFGWALRIRRITSRVAVNFLITGVDGLILQRDVDDLEKEEHASFKPQWGNFRPDGHVHDKV